MKKQMMRSNTEKPKLSYMLDFPKTMEAVSNVMTIGAEKYDRNNWKNGGPITEAEDSLLRHLTAFHNCQDEDPESGLSHLAHIICNASFIIENYERYGSTFDDRDWENASE